MNFRLNAGYQRQAAAYERRARRLAARSLDVLGVSASDASLRAAGKSWWNDGMACKKMQLAEVVRWPSFFVMYPEFADLPIRNCRPKAGEWDVGVSLFDVRRNGRIVPSEILVALRKDLLPHPQTFLDLLVHEAAHLIQCKQGRLTCTLNHKTPGYAAHPLEKEANDLMRTTPLVRWPRSLVGPIENFQFKIFDCIIPMPIPARRA